MVFHLLEMITLENLKKKEKVENKYFFIMIIEELKSIIKNPNDKNLGNKLNNLYNEFRADRDPNDILILLNSDDEMIGFGCDVC